MAHRHVDLVRPLLHPDDGRPAFTPDRRRHRAAHAQRQARQLGNRQPHRIHLLQEEIDEFYSNFRVSNDLIELRNLVVTAELIVRSALQRHESRGLHFSSDWPDTLPEAKDTVLDPRTARP